MKSQIHAGGRGKGKFKELPADAKGGVRVSFQRKTRWEIREMFGKTLVTSKPALQASCEPVYVEDGADIDRELYVVWLTVRLARHLLWLTKVVRISKRLHMKR